MGAAPSGAAFLFLIGDQDSLCPTYGSILLPKRMGYELLEYKGNRALVGHSPGMSGAGRTVRPRSRDWVNRLHEAFELHRPRSSSGPNARQKWRAGFS